MVLLAILQSSSMTGTSVSTPTVVASAAGEDVPNSATATATASSKKLEAPIIPAGAAISCGSFNSLHAIYAIVKIKNQPDQNCHRNGNACKGKFIQKIRYLRQIFPYRNSRRHAEYHPDCQVSLKNAYAGIFLCFPRNTS